MKKDFHPKDYLCEIELADGSITKVFLTKNLGKIKLDVDVSNHPAWNKNSLDGGEVFSEVSKFKNKFQDLEL